VPLKLGCGQVDDIANGERRSAADGLGVADSHCQPSLIEHYPDTGLIRINSIQSRKRASEDNLCRVNGQNVW